MRPPLIAGNWKMNGLLGDARALAEALRASLGQDAAPEMLVCPPFLAISAVAEILKGTKIRIGAQNMSWEAKGAFTGELSAAMLKEVGVSHVLLGHSERRHIMGETHEHINKKTKAALAAGRGVKARKADRDIEVYFEEFDDSSINLVIWLWIDYKGERDYVAARSELLMRVKTSFEQSKISIPFPIRTLELDVKGAAALASTLARLEMDAAEDPRGQWKGSGKADSEGAAVGREGPPEKGGEAEGDKEAEAEKKPPA